MGVRRVRTGSRYVDDPVPWDIIWPPYGAEIGRLVPGQTVVVKRPGCPPPNTMGHAHIADAEGQFLGLVHTNSLKPKERRR